MGAVLLVWLNFGISWWEELELKLGMDGLRLLAGLALGWTLGGEVILLFCVTGLVSGLLELPVCADFEKSPKGLFEK